MDAVHRDELKTLFEQALELPPDKRSAFLDVTCSGNTDLRRDLDSLLAHYARPREDEHRPHPPPWPHPDVC